MTASIGFRLFHLSAAVLASGVGAWWAARHPIGALAAPVLFALLVVGFAASGRWWLSFLLALWPIAGFTDWTGWILIEETDFLVWSCVAGWCLRRAILGVVHPVAQAAPQPPHLPGFRTGPALLVVLLLLISALWSTWPQISSAHLFSSFEPAAHYHAPQAALRMFKPYAWVVVLLLMIRVDHQHDPFAVIQALLGGMAAGLVFVSVSVVMERYAYTGLADFSSDYRATGPFWEMHVGGAALDAFVALSLPFAMMLVARARSLPLMLGSVLVMGLGTYTLIVTFSRATYVAAVVALLMVVVATYRLKGSWLRSDAGQTAVHDPSGLGSAMLLITLAAVSAVAIFPIGGYRGVVAYLVCALLLPSAVHRFRSVAHGVASSSEAGHGLVGAKLAGASLLGLVLGVVVGYAAQWVPKGPYALFGGIALAVVLVLISPARGAWGIAVWVAWTALLPLSYEITGYWGGVQQAELVWGSHIALWLLAGVTVLRRKAFWPSTLRWQMQLSSVMLTVPLLVGTVLGGVYMQSRAAAGSQDLALRQQHWSLALSTLQTSADHWGGLGVARFPQAYSVAMLAVPGLVKPGHQEWGLVESQPALKLIGAEPSMGFGEQHRVLQRIAAIGGLIGPFSFEAFAWASQRPVVFKVELCGRHLLYVSDCLEGVVKVPASDQPSWTRVQIVLRGQGRGWSGSPLEPQPVLALVNQSGFAPLWVRDIQLIDGQGRDRVSNGGFEQGLDRWFFSSDKHHLPWSGKNIGIHLLVEQGRVGLAVWAFVWGLALLVAVVRGWAGSTGHAVIATALATLLVVGMVDSLINHTRTLMLMLLFMSLALGLPRLKR